MTMDDTRESSSDLAQLPATPRPEPTAGVRSSSQSISSSANVWLSGVGPELADLDHGLNWHNTRGVLMLEQQEPELSRSGAPPIH